jgi:transcriptional regulator with XRE-family HTH domain
MEPSGKQLVLLVGRLISKHRRQAGLSQETLAGNAGLHPTYISLVETNKRAIGMALGLKLSDLLSQAECLLKNP